MTTKTNTSKPETLITTPKLAAIKKMVSEIKAKVADPKAGLDGDPLVDELVSNLRSEAERVWNLIVG